MANLSALSMLSETDGVLLVDKPAGMAAHDVERVIKAHFNLTKIAHGATLDPGASGVFALLLGDATKRAPELMGSDSTYEGCARLGCNSNTGDVHGVVEARANAALPSPELLEQVAREFRGDIYQKPPAFSAVRIAGAPDWQIVPSGKDETSRLVHVYRLALTLQSADRVAFALACTKGVSVRALVADLGQALGCGAVLEEVRRIKNGPFVLADSTPFMELLKLDALALRAKVRSVHEVLRR